MLSAVAFTSAGAGDLVLAPAPRDAHAVRLKAVPPRPSWEFEIGGRYWLSSGRTSYDLFGLPPDSPVNILVSRLTWSGLLSHSGEIFGRVDHATGFFIKGFVGGGLIKGGNLQDEDFPPFVPGIFYSSTNSEQRDGNLAYGTVDLGWAWRTEGFKLGFFAGYHQYHEHINGFGCAQTAANPAICVPALSPSILAITEDSTWRAVRLGFGTDFWFARGWRLSTDAAWIPFAWLSASDTHWLRTDLSAPIGQHGSGSLGNVQLEGALSYQFPTGLSVGVGGRYWNIATPSKLASAQFFSAIPSLQAITFRTERLGGFLQASYKFGELRPTRYAPTAP
jgi:hypothetical protein